MDIIIREMLESDWPRVRDIYCQGIEINIATFERECPAYQEWNTSHLTQGRIIAEVSGYAVGWAALSKVSGKQAYAGVAEESVYVDDDWKNKGIGIKLLSALCDISEKCGFWTLQAVIVEDNTASILLHEKAGFRKVGIREKIARDNSGVWRNTVLMEKRSELCF